MFSAHRYIQVVSDMTYITRCEFRQILLALYNDIQELRGQIRESGQREGASHNPSPPLAVRATIDAESSIETRTSITVQQGENSYRCWTLVVQWLTFLAVFGYGAVAAFQLREM